ncbi:hypothetical protein PYW07_014953 [Mythimna separata]|uniref:Apoptosis regulatory protein Siva n=1 Tax=Mythimna separata TaxID=271217 RepID=A0AAD7YZB7_MYTSE|nr:hypothetical protein PYW07_014953 [Mythimna separata]
MAKRTNPFIEDFIPQSKVHVGMKQFNNNEDRLKKVYEKTLLLLFKGAKKCPAQDITSEENALSATQDKQDKLKQLFIGKDGTLLHSGNMVDNKLSVKQCSCGGGVESQCAYCDMNLCGGCQHVCVRCERAHCLCCTMIGLEGSEVCVSCYS